MQEIDSIVSQAFRENPIQGALLGVLLDGGRIVSTGERSEGFLKSTSDVVSFERREKNDFFFFQKLSAKDLLFVEDHSMEELWELAHQSAAQVALLSPRKCEDMELVDFSFSESELRSALLSLGSKWEQIKGSAGSYDLDGAKQEKGLFLDRDGVVIEDTHYIHQASDVRLRPGIVEALKTARDQGYRLIVITNQSGMGRGKITWEQYDAVTLKMQQLLVNEGVFLDRIVKAPFFQDSTRASGLVRRSLRKPRPGMIHSVVNEFRLDLTKSILVGDSATDLMAGALAGVAKLVLVKSAKWSDELQKWQDWPLRSRLEATQSWKLVEAVDMSSFFDEK